MKLCRCCRKKLPGKISEYHSVYEMLGHGQTCAAYIKQWGHFWIRPSDELPQIMCNDCFGEVKGMFDFGCLVRDSVPHLAKESKDGDNGEKQCRCCLSTDGDEYHWIHEENDSGPTYAGIIEGIAKVKIPDSDGLTQQICSACFNQVDGWFDFQYYTVHATNEQFKKLKRRHRRRRPY